jgi:hypothetical protein
MVRRGSGGGETGDGRAGSRTQPADTVVATSPELVTQNFGGAAEARFTPAELLEIKGMWFAGVNDNRCATLIRPVTEAGAEGF